MRITKQLLHKTVPCPLERLSYLDLSSMRIPYIEQLDDCQKLHTLILQDNVIDSISNIEWCRELWSIDLSGNRVKSLQGLSRFPAIGSLTLNNNNIDWNELKRLSHMYILSLSLTGNNKLTNDNNYRSHVIDIIPHLWMLDGQLVTAGERKRVQNFFATSSTSGTHPVWRKVSSQSVFVPSNLQNLLVTGVYGERTTQLMAKFPMKYSHNIELDKKRLMYLSFLMEEEMKIENEYREMKGESSYDVPPLQQLMEQRKTETEQCNMLLLLLVTCLEFDLPTDLMIATLKTAKLSHINDFDCQSLFLLPSHVLYKTVTLLISGAAIDRDENKEGGLYPQLYQGLQLLISCYTRKTINRDNTSPTRCCTPASSTSTVSTGISQSLAPPTAPPPTHRGSAQYRQYRCLVASEVVHLMCLVPAFFHHLDSNNGVLEMVSVATNDANIGSVINHIAWRIQNNGGDVWDLYHEIATYLLQATTTNVFSKRHHNHSMTGHQKQTSHSSPVKSASSQIFQVPRRSSSPLPPPRRVSSAGPSVHTSGRRHRTILQPELGDKVLCAPERLARIVALPEPHVAVLQLTEVKGISGGPPDSYFYTDPRGLVWDSRLGHWSKDELGSDLSVGRLHTGDPQECYSSVIIRSPSPETRTTGYTRPSSQISYLSEDLQTIPSVEELSLVDDDTVIQEEEDEQVAVSSEVPMKVDISSREREKRGEGGRESPIAMMTQRPKTPEETEEAELHLQQHILEQYSISKTTLLQDMENEEEKPSSPDVMATLSLEAQKITTSYSNNTGFTDLFIPNPKLSFPGTWSSSKSLPHSLTASLSSKHRSCITPSSSNSTVIRSDGISQSFSPNPPLLSPTGGGQSPPEDQFSSSRSPIVVYAWNPVKPGHQPKQTNVSTVRSMRERSSSTHSRPSSRQSSPGSVILKPRPPVQSRPPSHMMKTYNPFQSTAVTAFKAKTKNNFQPNKSTVGHRRGGATRKLGDVGGITSVLGTSVW